MMSLSSQQITYLITFIFYFAYDIPALVIMSITVFY